MPIFTYIKHIAHLATHSSNWEDAISITGEQEASRSAPYLTMSDQLDEANSQSDCKNLGTCVPTSGCTGGSPSPQPTKIKDEMFSYTNELPIIFASASISSPPNGTHATMGNLCSGPRTASVEPVAACCEADERAPWNLYDSPEEDGGTEEDLQDNDPEDGVGTEDNPEDSCEVFTSFRALVDDTQKQGETDTELEAIGRTLELRIMANASESGSSVHPPAHSALMHTGSRAKSLHGKRRRFDQWDKVDPVDSEAVSNILIKTNPYCSH